MIRVFRRRCSAQDPSRFSRLTETEFRVSGGRLFPLEALEDRLPLSASWDCGCLPEYNIVSEKWFDSKSVAVEAAWSDRSLVNRSDSVLPSASPVEFEWIVRLSPQVSAAIDSITDAANYLEVDAGGFDVIRGLGLPGMLLVRSSGMSAAEASQFLNDNPNVIYHDPNSLVIGQQTTPNDVQFGEQIGLHAIAAAEAWGVTTGSRDIVVGVVDTGIEMTHPDLFENIWLNQGEIPQQFLVAGQPLSLAEFEDGPNALSVIDFDEDGLITFLDLNFHHEEHGRVHQRNGVVADRNGNNYIDAQDLLADPAWANNNDDDLNGFPDDLVGWDFYNNDNDPSDDHRHGTHVAGIIGATGNNEVGVAGVNWQTSLMSLKFLNGDNRGSMSDAILATNYATMMKQHYGVNIRVTNNSWGELAEINTSLLEAIAASGEQDMLFVAAAGNGDVFGDGIDIDRRPFYPASFDLDNIISVAALDPDGRRARFSNYGRQTVSLTAPGVGIVSTTLSNGYEVRSGTSMAAPAVAGAAALVFAARPGATAVEVREALLRSTRNEPGIAATTNHGQLDLAAALHAETFAPLASVSSAPPIRGIPDEVQQTEQIISINYEDDDGVDLTTLDDNDLRVFRRHFPDVQLQARMLAESLRVMQTDDTGQPILVTIDYLVEPPRNPVQERIRTWNATDNGHYELRLVGGEVADLLGVKTAPRNLGSFSVEIDDPSVLFVDSPLTPNGNKANLEMRQAVALAHELDESHVTIVIPAGTYDLSPNGLTIQRDLTLVGAGPNWTILDAGKANRVIDIVEAKVQLSGMRLTGGFAQVGGGLRNLGGDIRIDRTYIVGNEAAQAGGGIYNTGHILIRDSEISENVTRDALGQGGGGAFNAGRLDVLSSTVAENVTAGGFLGEGGGGGILQANEPESILNLANVTVSGNIAERGNGGGVSVLGASTFTGVTVTANRAEFGSGGGVFSSGSTIIRNSIVASNTALLPTPDLAGVFVSEGGNLVGRLDNNTPLGGQDLWGSLESPLDPGLGPLRAGGESTRSHAVLPNSPAIDVGNQLQGWSEDQLSPRRNLASSVANINTSSTFDQPSSLLELNGKIYLFAFDGETGRELYEFDPATENFSVVADILVGTESSGGSQLTKFGDSLVFTSDDGVNDEELYRFHPETNTLTRYDLSSLLDFFRSRDVGIQEFVEYAGTLYFPAQGDFGVELYRLNPMTDEIELVENINTGTMDPLERSPCTSDSLLSPRSSCPSNLTVFQDKLFFSAIDYAKPFLAAPRGTGNELYVHDSDDDSTQLLADINPGTGDGSPHNFLVTGDLLFFTADNGENGEELFRYDPVSESVAMVADVRPGLESSSPRELVKLGDRIFFSADAGDGRELHQFDLVTGQHQLVEQLAKPGFAGSSPEHLTVLGSEVVFLADNGTTGRELYRFDTKDDSLHEIADINLASDSRIEGLTVHGGQLFFSADDGVSGTELFRYDPETLTTTLIADIVAGSTGSNPRDFVSSHDSLFFISSRSDGGDDLYRYQLRSDAATRIANVSRGSFSSFPRELTELLGDVYFHANDGIHGEELYRWNRATGVAELIELQPGAQGSRPSDLVVLNNKLYFAANGANGRRLHEFDPVTEQLIEPTEIQLANAATLHGEIDSLFFHGFGTEGVQLFNYRPSEREVRPVGANLSVSKNTFRHLVVNDDYFFVAETGRIGYELYRYDPVTEEVQLVANIQEDSPRDDGSMPDHLTAFDGRIYFSADDSNSTTSETGRELYVYDPITGNVSLFDLYPGRTSSDPRDLVVFGNELLFAATVDDRRARVFRVRLDGTTIEEVDANREYPFPRDFTILKDQLYFVGGDHLYSYEMQSNMVEYVAELSPGFGRSDFEGPIVFGDDLLFVYRDGQSVGGGSLFDLPRPISDAMLYRFDPDSGLVSLVADVDLLQPRFASSEIEMEYLQVGNELFFAADDGLHGWELWRLSDADVANPTNQIDAGAVERLSGDVSGTVFVDRNGNGLRETSEQPLVDWTVFVDVNDNQRLDAFEPHAVTVNDNPATLSIDESGSFLIEGVPPGDVIVRIVSSPTFQPSSPVVVQEDVIPELVQVALVPSDADPSSVLRSKPRIVGGEIVFRDHQGRLYSRSRDQSTIFDLQDVEPVPAGRGATIGFDGQLVSFLGSDAAGGLGVFVSDGQNVVGKLADGSTTIPGGRGNFAPNLFSIHSIVGGVVGFLGGNEHGAGAYAATPSGSIARLADRSTSLPNGATIERFTSVQLGPDQFAIGVLTNDGAGIYAGLSEDSLKLLVDRHTPIPLGVGVFRDLDAVSFAMFGDRVVFRGFGDIRRFAGGAQQGVYVTHVVDQTLERVADKLTPVPNGEGRFIAFGDVAIGSDAIVFIGYGENVGETQHAQQGIYVNFEGQLRKVVDLNEDFSAFVRPGVVPRSLNIGKQALSGNEIVFHVLFSDNSTGIFLADYAAESFQIVSLQSGSVVNDVHFGQRPLDGGIEGLVFNDVDLNGVQDENEPGLAGWTVFLDQNGNRMLESGEPWTTTDEGGNYEFVGMAGHSNHAIVGLLEENWEWTSPVETGVWDVFLESSQQRRDVNFGVHSTRQVGGAARNGIITGTVFEDLNGNGRREIAEAALVREVVFLDLNGDRQWNDDPIREPLRRTDQQGRYEFRRLELGTYDVRILPDPSRQQRTPKGNSFLTNPFLEILDKPAAIGIAQLDGIGAFEVIVARSETNLVSIISDPFGDNAYDSSVEVGLTPVAIAIADFDNDGIDDFAVANEGSDDVTFIMGTNEGTVRTGATWPVGDGPRALASHDIDGDGDLDVVVTNGVSNDISVLINDGNAGFRVGDAILVGSSPSGIVFLPLTNDSRIDLAVSLRDDHQVVLMRNEGSGHFSEIRRVNVAQNPIGLTALQLNDDNNDGRVDADDWLDLAIAGLRNSFVTTLTTNGNKRPTLRRDHKVENAPTSILADDIDMDGDQDIIVSAGEGVSILRNRGDGNFQASELAGNAVIRFASTPLDLAAGDLDGDGDIDLALANGVANGVTFLKNRILDRAYVRLVGSTPAEVDFGLQPINVEPTLDPLPDITVNEDRPEFAIPLTGISAGAAEVQDIWLEISVAPANTLVVPEITYEANSTSGTLLLRLLPNQHGTAEVIVTINDVGIDGVRGTPDDLSTPRSFTLTVTPVNDPPSALNDEFVVPMGATDFTLDVLANDILANPDVDETLVIFRSTISSVIGTTYSPDGKSLLLTLTPFVIGTHVFSYFVSDGIEITQGEVTLHIEGTVVTGDFDADGVLTTFDIELLSQAIRNQATDAIFDLNGDGQVDPQDRITWVKQLRGTFFGDVNLDGEFNSRDLISIFASAKFETDEPASWGDGDWSGDGRFDTNDLVVAFADGGFEQGPVAAVFLPQLPHDLVLANFDRAITSSSINQTRILACNEKPWQVPPVFDSLRPITRNRSGACWPWSIARDVCDSIGGPFRRWVVANRGTRDLDLDTNDTTK